MADLIRGTTPSYIVDFTDSGVNVADIIRIILQSGENLIFLNPKYNED